MLLLFFWLLFVRGPHSGSSGLHIFFNIGTGFASDTLPDAALPFYPGLGPELRVNPSIAGLATCPGIKPRPLL